MKFVIEKKIGPYDGPYEENITTYKLKTPEGVITWHENGKRGLNGMVGECFNGLVLNSKKKPNYKKSKIKNTQTKLL